MGAGREKFEWKDGGGELKKIIVRILPLVLFFYLADKIGQGFRLAGGVDIGAKILNLGSGLSAAFIEPLPSFHPQDLLVGVIGAGLIALVLHIRKRNAKKFRKGMEHGSARFGTAADIKPFIDPVFDNNVILTQTERLTMDSRPKNPANARNKNVLVIGGSGSGKTRFFFEAEFDAVRLQGLPRQFRGHRSEIHNIERGGASAGA